MSYEPIPTPVYDRYWRFAAERQEVYFRRFVDPSGPWTDDPIIGSFRFTNVFRAADRVSQYLIREVQYRSDRSQAPDEVLFRTLLFKLFNRVETWETIERELGTVSWQSWSRSKAVGLLDHLLSRGSRVYSAAYIMPSPAFGYERKHSNHLALLDRMMGDGLASKLRSAQSLREVYLRILAYPGIGPFLAFQFAIDLNYSSLLHFGESEYVVAGPGALDGISKCFSDTGGLTAEAIIYQMVDRQDQEFDRLGLPFKDLFGRKLQPIDCQNVFCEISKYARVAHPGFSGLSGRTRIKQKYRASSHFVARPFFPPKWKLELAANSLEVASQETGQLSLF